MNKTLKIVSVAGTFLFVGFFAISTPAEAGFFDWLFGNNNASSQEAAAIKAQTVKKVVPVVAPTTQTVDPNTGTGPYNPLPVQTVDKVAPITQVVAPTISSSLKLGSKGAEVSNLQTKLKELGYFKGSVDGSYGKATADAVKAFQRANKLVVDGIAGKGVMGKMVSGAVKAPVRVVDPNSGTGPYNPLPGSTDWIDNGDGTCYSSVAGATGTIVGSGTTVGSTGLNGNWCLGDGWAEYNFDRTSGNGDPVIQENVQKKIQSIKNNLLPIRVSKNKDLIKDAYLKFNTLIQKGEGVLGVEWIDMGDGDCVVEGAGWGTISTFAGRSCRIWTPEGITYFF